jgi:hypothetical protein
MRTLLIDNYDSYTFNLFHLLGEVNGEEPIVVRNDELPWDELVRLAPENVVISPGPGAEARHEWFPRIAAGQSVRVEAALPLSEGQALAMVSVRAWQGAKRHCEGNLMRFLYLDWPHLAHRLEAARATAPLPELVVIGGQPWEPASVLDASPAAVHLGVPTALPVMARAELATVVPDASFSPQRAMGPTVRTS